MTSRLPQIWLTKGCLYETSVLFDVMQLFVCNFLKPDEQKMMKILFLKITSFVFFSMAKRVVLEHEDIIMDSYFKLTIRSVLSF